MGIANRRSASRGLLATFTIGVGLAGCAQPAKSPAVAVEKPAVTTSKPDVAIAPVVAPDDASRAVADSVGDNVARVDAILRKRAEAQQLADDVRTQREARAASVVVAPTTRPTDGTADEIERLAAEIRALKDRAAKPAAVAAVDPASDLNGALATPTQIEIKRAGDRALPAVDPLVALDRQFAGKVAEDPKSLDAQLGLQLLRFLKNDAVPSTAELAPLPSEDKELLSSVCDALSNFRNVVRASPNPMTSEKSRPFVEMADRIRARADLHIASASLCTAVRKFGDYDPIEPLRFVSGTGEPTKAVFYCEVDGFQSMLDEKDRWATKLSLSMKLYNSDAVEVWAENAAQVADSSRRRRHDFFIGKIIQLPSTLAPGRYLMKVTVRDLQGNRVDESTLQVDFVAK